jgi:DNA-binding response OmpR family regulator
MSAQTYRILAVDDMPDNLFLLQTILEAEGFAVDVATSGRLALNKIRMSPPDLILLDVMMPEMDGYAVTQQIRQGEKLLLPILLITAYDEAVVAKGLELGANDFVRKPINFEDLLARIKRFLKLEQNFGFQAIASHQQEFSSLSNSR